MPFLGIEPVAEVILAELKAGATGLPKKLADLERTFTVQLKMPPPVEYVFAEKAMFTKGYPVVQLVQLDTLAANEDPMRWTDDKHRFEIGVFLQSDLEENLARLVDRYTRAVREVLHERRKADAFPFDLRWKGERISYSATFPQAGQFIRAVFLPMRAERRDTERH
jgi:hypothetical protein